MAYTRFFAKDNDLAKDSRRASGTPAQPAAGQRCRHRRDERELALIQSIVVKTLSERAQPRQILAGFFEQGVGTQGAVVVCDGGVGVA